MAWQKELDAEEISSWGLELYEAEIEYGEQHTDWVKENFETEFGVYEDPEDEYADDPRWLLVEENQRARQQAGRDYKEVKLDDEVTVIIYGHRGYEDVEKVRRVLQEHFKVQGLGVDGDEETCVLTTGKGAV